MIVMTSGLGGYSHGTVGDLFNYGGLFLGYSE